MRVDADEPDLWRNVMRLIQPQDEHFQYDKPFPRNFAQEPSTQDLNPVAQLEVHYAFLQERLAKLGNISQREDLQKCLDLFKERSRYLNFQTRKKLPWFAWYFGFFTYKDVTWRQKYVSKLKVIVFFNIILQTFPCSKIYFMLARTLVEKS